MPINKYFNGNGSEVMANMTKEYGAKKGKSVFYATANKKGMKPKSMMPKGATQSPKGDIGEKRQMESVMAGGFKAGKTVCAYKELPYGR